MSAVDVTIRREEDGTWCAEIPFMELTGPLGHQSWSPYTPWVALKFVLRAWAWWELRRQNMHLDYIDFVRQEAPAWEKKWR